MRKLRKVHLATRWAQWVVAVCGTWGIRPLDLTDDPGAVTCARCRHLGGVAP